jgi:hypothetical protein
MALEILTGLKFPFILHAAIETLAGISFVLQPELQIAGAEKFSAGYLVVQSMGGMILSSNLICLIFIARPVFDDTSRLVAGALAFWHIWPSYRAMVRILRGDGTKTEQTQFLGGPPAHLAFHALLTALFIRSAL